MAVKKVQPVNKVKNNPQKIYKSRKQTKPVQVSNEVTFEQAFELEIKNLKE